MKCSQEFALLVHLENTLSLDGMSANLARPASILRRLQVPNAQHVL
jgi:hypothetical protein